MRLKKTTHSIYNIEFTVEAAVRYADGLVMDRSADAFLIGADNFGFEPSDLGRHFDCGSERFRIIGLKPRAKQPVICERISPASDRLYQMAPRVIDLLKEFKNSEARSPTLTSAPYDFTWLWQELGVERPGAEAGAE